MKDIRIESQVVMKRPKLFETDTVLKDKRERWHKSLAGDVYVEEALNVLQDLKINNIRKSKIAAIKD